MLEAVATGCHRYEACWHAAPPPDGFPFGSPQLAAVWGALFIVCFAVLIRRLGRG